PGHSKQVGMATASCHAGAYANRFVVVVDDDIDPTDTNEVLWAMCTRTDVIDDIDVMKRCWSTSLDPMAYAGEGEGEGYYNNRMIIDACRPYDRLATFPEVVRTSDDDATKLRARWPDLFGADGSEGRAGDGHAVGGFPPTGTRHTKGPPLPGGPSLGLYRAGARRGARPAGACRPPGR
ncbi:MAG: UbiD family decarboxylase, partial [Chloroflexi bacterium]|nr:UbiD family decarboxylase [Chloroflexota bacterium]